MDASLTRVTEKLVKDEQKVVAFFENLTDEQASAIVYSTELDTWKVKDILSHLTFSEIGFLDLLQNVVDGGNGTEENFDVDQYNFEHMLPYKDLTLNEVIHKYRSTRRMTLEFLENLTQEDLIKTGLHPALGVTTLLDMTKMIFIHAQIHMQDVKKTLIGSSDA